MKKKRKFLCIWADVIGDIYLLWIGAMVAFVLRQIVVDKVRFRDTLRLIAFVNWSTIWKWERGSKEDWGGGGWGREWNSECWEYACNKHCNSHPFPPRSCASTSSLSSPPPSHSPPLLSTHSVSSSYVCKMWFIAAATRKTEERIEIARTALLPKLQPLIRENQVIF